MFSATAALTAQNSGERLRELEEETGGGKEINSIVEGVCSLYRLPTPGEGPQHQRLPELAVTLISGERSREEVPGSSATPPKCLSRLQTSPAESSRIHSFPPASTHTPGSENPAWTVQRSRALTTGSPPEPPASMHSCSPSFSSPRQGEAPRSTHLWGGSSDPSRQSRLTHLATAASSCGAENTQPMVRAGKRQTKSRRAAVSVCTGRCGGTCLT